ncbi:tail fiber protein, partial [Nocardioides kongjuensis]
GDTGAMRLGMQAGKTYTVSAGMVGTNHPGGDFGDRTDAIVVFHRVGAGAYTELSTGPVTGGRGSLTFTLPSGATEAFIRLYHGGGSALSYTDWQQVILEEATSETGPYFDGSTPDSTSDFTLYDRAWTGTANNSTSTEAATVTLPYATAVNSNLGYLDPVQYLNVIGESHELRVVRQELQVGTLDATIISRTLDPADSALIRPGRRARLRALVAGVWEELITGKLLTASVEYELKDPKLPDEKRATITVNLVDAGQPLSQAKRPQGVATIAELPFVLEGAGVPWNVNGSGNQVATATPTTFNDNASALTQVALTRDTRAGYAWVSRRGVVNAWDPGSLPAPAPVVLDETTYSDLKVTFATDDCINAVAFTVQSLGVDGTTTETTYGPYEDATSIETYGRFLKEFTVTGLSKAQVDTLAAAIIAANKTPSRRVQSVTLPLTKLARVDAHALRDLYDLVKVNNTEVALSANLRVTGIEHVVTTRSWLLTLTFAANGGVASPIFQPPVQSDASPDVGVIEWFAGPTSKVPSTKLVCDGSSKAVASYPYLFAVIGYTYGGSGANFNVPNLVDRFPIGAGTKALGTTGGGPTKTLAVANLPGGHPTGYTGSSLMGSGPTPAFGVTATGGTSTPFDVMNPWLALTPVIRAV